MLVRASSPGLRLMACGNGQSDHHPSSLIFLPINSSSHHLIPHPLSFIIRPHPSSLMYTCTTEYMYHAYMCQPSSHHLIPHPSSLVLIPHPSCVMHVYPSMHQSINQSIDRSINQIIVYMYVHMPIYIHIYIYIHICIYTYACMYIHLIIHIVYIYICICINIYIYMCNQRTHGSWGAWVASARPLGHVPGGSEGEGSRPNVCGPEVGQPPSDSHQNSNRFDDDLWSLWDPS